MMTLAERLGYLAVSSAKWVVRIGLECPSCGGKPVQVLDRKFLVTQLRRCSKCDLVYRSPTGNLLSMENFYERRYEEGFTTNLPIESELQKLLRSAFKGTEKDYSSYLEVLAAIGARPGMRLLDFGCSWGYGSWQLARAGFDVSSFEISSRRCRFARDRLKIDAYNNIDLVHGDFDIIFSAHVLEHVPSVGATISRLWSMLRDGGYFVAFTPNGSLAYREKQRNRWHSSWGSVHPNMLDEIYYNRIFASVPRILASSPYPIDLIHKSELRFSKGAQNDISGSELLCVAVKSAPHLEGLASSIEKDRG